MSLIEHGARNMQKQERARSIYPDIFNLGIEILEAHGELRRNAIGPNKYTVVEHTSNIFDRPVNIKLKSSADLATATKIYITIEGTLGTYIVTKRKKKGKDSFGLEYSSDGVKQSNERLIYFGLDYSKGLQESLVQLRESLESA